MNEILDDPFLRDLKQNWRIMMTTSSTYTVYKNQNIVNVNIYDVLNSIKPKEYKINEIPFLGDLCKVQSN